MSHTSVLILTLNEEVNLAACLDSCAWCDDIVVFDSFSTDRTLEIARTRGARVVQRTFDDYGAQRNAALSEVEYRHPWVLMVDADERVSPALAEEIARALRTVNEEITLFRMRRKDRFFGRWLRRSSGYPTWFGRLAKIGRVRVERAYNEEFLTDGAVATLNEHLEHYPFNKGISWWQERHNRYSTMEAAATLAERTQRVTWSELLSRDPAIQRRALKRFAYRLPARPVFVFIYLYILRLGFLDGLPGLYFTLLRAHYELMIDLKLRELRYRRANLPV